ncbi:MAG: DUF2267 domain-containing protein [Myxococcaceae bacterium]|nr:DUF2267 domain-containing protein [Myxococcaceae bacterium]MCI0669229.1 DUF2267 domain-containing protein [Myxococcaceae bacterium]
MAQESREDLANRSAQRHASRTGTTYAAFIRHLCEVGNLEPAVAECAAIAVLSALERRIRPEESRQLEAQLPRKLVEFLEVSGARTSAPRRFGKGAFLESVADDLRMDPAKVEPVVRAVLAALQDQISEGEAADVAAQLPEDLRALWQPAH